MCKVAAPFAALLIASIAGLPWKAEATTGPEKAFIAASVKDRMPIQKIACWPRKIDACPWHKKRRHGRCIPCTY
jgi:hypothetical protein